MKYRRINFYAGANAGKSGMAAWLFSMLKTYGVRCGYVKELVEEWAWQGRRPRSFDQVFLLATQLHREDELLYGGCEVVVTDSPLLLSCSYGMMFDVPEWERLVKIACEFERRFPSIHIMLNRGDWGIDPAGRFIEDSGVYSDPAATDEVIKRFVLEHLDGGILYEVDATDREGCLDLVLRELGVNA